VKQARSLRRRLLFGSATAVSVVLVIAGAVLYLLVRSYLYRQLDQTLLEQVQHVASLVEYDEQGLELEFSKLDGPEYTAQDRAAFYTLRDAGGAVVARSPSLLGEDLPDIGGPLATPRTARLGNGRRVRMTAISFLPDREGSAAQASPLHLVVARDMAPVEAALGHLVLLLGAIWSAATLACVLVLWWVVRRGLAPATALASEIARIDPGTFRGQIDVPGAPAELLPVVQKLNGLLSRIEETIAREKSFLGAAAHELRTPLAGLRATLEVTLLRTRTAAEYETSLRECEELAETMQARVSALLSLARIDARQEPVRRETVHLRPLLERALLPVRVRAEHHGLALRLDLSPDEWVVADPKKLGMVLDNILDNAVSHCDAKGAIEIASRVVGATLQVSVTNPACRLPPEDLPRVFDRFFRGDPARGDEGGHLGLGLSLCKELVTRMGGEIRAFAADGRFGLVFSLPRAEPAGAETLEAAR